MAIYYFKEEDYKLAKAFKKAGGKIYCEQMGYAADKTYEVYSFDKNKIYIGDDEELKNVSPDDFEQPVVFQEQVSDLDINVAEWEELVYGNQLYCYGSDLDEFMERNERYMTTDYKVRQVLAYMQELKLHPKTLFDYLKSDK